MVDAPLPTAGRGEVGVRVLVSSVQYTDVLIRRHLTRKLRLAGRRAEENYYATLEEPGWSRSSQQK